MKLARDCLINLVCGLKKWSGNWKEIPKELDLGHRMFIQLTLEEGKIPPPNLLDLLRNLREPCSSWGVQAFLDVFDGESSLFEDYYGLSDVAETFLEQHISPEESEQKVMLEILKYCRAQSSHGTEDKEKLIDYDELYRRIRSYITQPEHAVITSGEMFEFAMTLQDPKLSVLFRELYEQVPEPYEQYYHCPYCQWTLMVKKGRIQCASNTCSIKGEFRDLKPLQQTSSDTLFRLTRGIQRYVLVPGIAEYALFKRLLDKGYTVQLYPDIDEADIRITCEGKTIDLDVKEYYSYHNLASYLNERWEKYQRPNYHLVIPSHVTGHRPGYIDLVKSFLSYEASKVISIKSEKEILQLLEEESHAGRV